MQRGGAESRNWRGVRHQVWEEVLGLSRRGGYRKIRENPNDENQELSLNSCTTEHRGERERGQEEAGSKDLPGEDSPMGPSQG